MADSATMLIELPKYSTIYLYGDTIDTKDAQEAIRKTDKFFDSLAYWQGDSRAQYLFKRFSLPKLNDDPKLLNQSAEQMERWYEDVWGGILLMHLGCEFVWTPDYTPKSGWCWPDGTISLRRIIKWGTIEELAQDLGKMARLVPSLKASMVISAENFNTITVIKCTKGHITHYEGSLQDLTTAMEKTHRAFDHYGEIELMMKSWESNPNLMLAMQTQ